MQIRANAQLQRLLKQALDGNGIVASGRYAHQLLEAGLAPQAMDGAGTGGSLSGLPQSPAGCQSEEGRLPGMLFARRSTVTKMS